MNDQRVFAEETEMVDADASAHGAVLITGASSGLGAHFAKMLARQGYAVAMCARRADRLESLAGEIRQDGGRCEAIALDVERPDQIAPAFDHAERAFGPVRAVVNNAGVNAGGPLLELSPEAFDALFHVNVRGALLCAQEAVRRWLARGPEDAAHGRIVNIASIGGHTVLPGLAAYCSSKAALIMLTRAMAREWARHRIAVNAICPGYIETELNSDWLNSEGGSRMIAGFPRKRLMRAEDLDATLQLLLDARAAYVTGSIITIDDGQSL